MPSRASESCSFAYRTAEGPMSTPRRLAPKSIGTPMMSTRSTGENVVLTPGPASFRRSRAPARGWARLQELRCAANEPTTMLRHPAFLAAIALSVAAVPVAPPLAYLPPPLAHLNRDVRTLARRVPAAIALDVLDLNTGYAAGFNAARSMPA